jgi:hypothetical protein
MFSPSMIAATVSEFVSILEPEVPAIGNLAGVNQSILSDVTSGLDALKSGAAALATADSSEAAAPIAQRIIADGEAVLNGLTALPLPPQLAVPVRIASMVFGFLPGIVGMLFPAAPPAPAAAAA